MATFSFTQTKIGLTVGAMLGVSLLLAGVIGLAPNKAKATESGYEQPPPMSSLVEECGNFYGFNQDTIELTNGNMKDKYAVVVPVTPKDTNVEALPESAFRYYPLQELNDLPTVDQLVQTAITHEGYILWYSVTAPDEFVQALAKNTQNMDEKVILAPWTGGYGGNQRTSLPQDRDFAYMSYSQITQSCKYAEPYSFKSFVEYTNK